MVCEYTHRNIIQLLKKEILPFSTTWRNLEGIMLSEISQTEKDRYLILLICGIKNKKQKSNSQKQSRKVVRGWGMREIGRGW